MKSMGLVLLHFRLSRLTRLIRLFTTFDHLFKVRGYVALCRELRLWLSDDFKLNRRLDVGITLNNFLAASDALGLAIMWPRFRVSTDHLLLDLEV